MAQSERIVVREEGEYARPKLSLLLAKRLKLKFGPLVRQGGKKVRLKPKFEPLVGQE